MGLPTPLGNITLNLKRQRGLLEPRGLSVRLLGRCREAGLSHLVEDAVTLQVT